MRRALTLKVGEVLLIHRYGTTNLTTPEWVIVTGERRYSGVDWGHDGMVIRPDGGYTREVWLEPHVDTLECVRQADTPDWVWKIYGYWLLAGAPAEEFQCPSI
jgi:hypothetical protein